MSADNSTTSSFWTRPEMQARLAKTQARLAVALPVAPSRDQDLDQDRSRSKNIRDQDRSRSMVSHSLNRNDLDPDGLNGKIRGEFATLLKHDPDYLTARKLGVHPATLTNATKRMGADWVRQQIGFVLDNPKIGAKGRYLAKILAKNPY